MKKIIFTLIAILAAGFTSQIKAQEFFDTSEVSKLFTFGARLGFNTSNRSFPSGNYINYTKTSWGLGFNVGVVANMNFKEYLSLQPGFFFQSRNSSLVNIVDYYPKGEVMTYPRTHYEVNDIHSYYFTIPVMAIVKFNIAERIKWNVEAGPYFQFSLKETGSNNIQMLSLNDLTLSYDQYLAEHKKTDVGIKLGTALTFYSHYYVGVHYMAGILNAWKVPAGGKNKCWEFTLGYEF